MRTGGAGSDVRAVGAGECGDFEGAGCCWKEEGWEGEGGCLMEEKKEGGCKDRGRHVCWFLLLRVVGVLRKIGVLCCL